MRIPQKWQYALRATFELAARDTRDAVKVADIADAQAIPPRFLEIILNQLKGAGIVESKRGSAGGYRLALSPQTVTVGDILRRLQGASDPVGCGSAHGGEDCRFSGDCVFLPMWERAWQAMWTVYDDTTLQDLVDDAQRRQERYVPSYSI